MLRLRVLLALTLCLAYLTGCGDIEPEHHLSVSPAVNEKRLMEQNHLAQLRREQDFRQWTAMSSWLSAVTKNAETGAMAAAGAGTSGRATTDPPVSALPPDWVVQRESGGDYNAYNPTGCGGLGCYGRYQFSGEWACRLGLPCDLSTATPAQQDAAAAELWNNGAGCSNWNAC